MRRSTWTVRTRRTTRTDAAIAADRSTMYQRRIRERTPHSTRRGSPPASVVVVPAVVATIVIIIVVPGRLGGRRRGGLGPTGSAARSSAPDRSSRGPGARSVRRRLALGSLGASTATLLRVPPLVVSGGLAVGGGLDLQLDRGDRCRLGRAERGQDDADGQPDQQRERRHHRHRPPLHAPPSSRASGSPR